jgi:hypothetical protein
MNLDLRVVIEEQEEKVYNELVNSLEFWFNSSIPDVEISDLLINFREIRYDVSDVFAESDNQCSESQHQSYM